MIPNRVYRDLAFLSKRGKNELNRVPDPLDPVLEYSLAWMWRKITHLVAAALDVRRDARLVADTPPLPLPRPVGFAAAVLDVAAGFLGTCKNIQKYP